MGVGEVGGTGAVAGFVQAKDGKRIAYDVTGRGPALVLLHGAGKTRRDWHKLGYVRRLMDDFTVIAIDMRGTGESDAPVEIADYSVETICDDVTAVVDACSAEHFLLWGYSLGGHVGKYLASWTERVLGLVVVGVPLWGPTVDPALDRFITDFTNKWRPVVDAREAGGAADRARKSAIKSRMSVWLACFGAMRGWPALEPGSIECPTLLLAGTKSNTGALAWAEDNREVLTSVRVQVVALEGLDHPQEFSEIDRVFVVARRFLERTVLEG
jgi:pimeloyl-ACP methyl ester carboxylesterase